MSFSKLFEELYRNRYDECLGDVAPCVHGQALGVNAGNVGSETLSYDEGRPIAELTMDLSHNRLSSIDFDMVKVKNFFLGSTFPMGAQQQQEVLKD